MILVVRYLFLGAIILNFINTRVAGEISSQNNNKFIIDRDSFIDPYEFLLNLNENSYDFKFTNCEDHVDDIYWDNRFTLPGVNGTIWTMALDGNDIYIGGEFTFAGKERVNKIAVLNTINGEWSALGEGITRISPLDDSDPIVYAVEILNGAVYVAGCFKKAGDINVNNIACWNGQEWNNVGDGVTSNPNPQSAVIRALSSDGSNLFAGGSFNLAGTTSVANLARWDGSGWHDVGGGVTGNGWPDVMTLESDGTELYVGGGFNSAGGIEANRIAMWDGANWHTFGIMKGFLTSSFVHSIEKYGDNLYVAGGFNGADGITSPGIIRWDGTAWQPMDGGVSQGVITTWVNDIAINSDSTIFISGNFTNAGGDQANFIAYWGNGNWNPLLDGINNGVSHAVMSLCINSSDEVYAGGYFQSAGGHSVSRIAKWINNDWIILGNPANSVNGTYVEAIETVGNNVYAGGYFTFAGIQLVNNIAGLSEDFSWSPLNGGTNGSVYAIEQCGDSLIVGGYFDLAGGSAVNNIAVWDGANWSSLGEGLNGPVADILAIGDNIYVGGYFSASGGLNLNNVACWDKALNEWQQLGNGTNGFVYDLEFYNGGLCVGGSFNRAGNIDANFIAYWDGIEWSNLGNGPTNIVLSIAVFNNELYAAVDQGIGVCRWDGYNWAGIGTPWTLTLSADENYLYAGGAFYEFEGAPGNCIARWDGQSWSEMGSGTDGTVHTIAVSEDNSIYLGGTFTCAGNKPSYYIARWKEVNVGVNEETIFPDRPILSGNYPNPFNASTTINYTLPKSAYVVIEFYDVVGRRINKIDNGFQSAGYYSIVWNAENHSSGIYFYRIRAGNFNETRKMILIK